MKTEMPIFCGSAWRWCFWFRVMGYGLSVKLTSQHIPLFSERQGYRKVTYLGPICVEVLKP